MEYVRAHGDDGLVDLQAGGGKGGVDHGRQADREHAALYNERGVALISGYSPNSLKEILDENFQNPVDVMVKTLSRYMN